MLNQLTLLIDDLDCNTPKAPHLELLSEVFHRHFLHEGVLVNGLKLRLNMKSSRVPQFKSKPETFVHIITREDKSGKRYFDCARANRIHWIKPILLSADCQSTQVLTFNKSHDKTGHEQWYYWFKEKEFVVILRRYDAAHYLVTAFCVESTKAKRFQRWYEASRKENKPHIVCGARSLGTATG